MSKNIDISEAAPSHIAASTTCPLPDFLASSSAASTPTTRVERAAAEIADQIERRHRPFLRADRRERAGDGDIIDVMAGRLRQRAFLTPAGHAAIDEARVARLHHVRPQPKPLHHARAKAFDQRVGVGKQIEHLRDGSPVLEVEFDDLAPAPGHRFEILLRADAVERHHLRAHVRQHHAGEGAGVRCRRIRRCERRSAVRRRAASGPK